jgi:hypothetical protein
VRKSQFCFQLLVGFVPLTKDASRISLKAGWLEIAPGFGTHLQIATLNNLTKDLL